MSSPRPEFVCACFFNKNIFLKKYKLHITYECDRQFQEQYRDALRLKGCSTDKQYDKELAEIHQEITRRRNYHATFLDNYITIQKKYKKLHPHIWKLNFNMLDSRFTAIAQEAQQLLVLEGNRPLRKEMMSHIIDNGGNITDAETFRFPVFTKITCQQIMEEIENFSNCSIKKTQPNTMNKGGVSLDEMGLSEGLITPLIKDYLQPITKVLFPNWGGGSLDSYKSFVVKYEHAGDTNLSWHYDNSEITLNISLNSNFRNGELQLMKPTKDGEEDQGIVVISHEEGHGILHCGRQQHSALPITAGVRYNIIVWMRSSMIRNKLCPMCQEKPTLVQVSTAGDGFYPENSLCNLL
ncbi:unnamed protein product [Lymnaea stagnalis]|uniref:Fe2OG dioxygenase domain-containing protein n=1 Tax=Lymnaea stagnalis TaxID=6523 RepID=A0AAV2H1B2_LYMST